MAFCANCGEEIKDGVNFCPNCGEKISEQRINNTSRNGSKATSNLAAISTTCSSCGYPISIDDEICPHCGHRFSKKHKRAVTAPLKKKSAPKQEEFVYQETPNTAKVKKPIYKRPWVIAIVAIFILAAIFSGGGSSEGNKNPANNSNGSPNDGRIDGGDYASKETYKLYIDAFSERNLLFSTYDIVIKLDDKELGAVKNGEYLQKIFDAEKGDHELTFVERGSSSNKTTQRITVNGDMTFQCDLKHTSGAITLSNMNMEEGVSGYSIEVPNVVGMTVDKAVEALNSAGIKNIDKPYKVDDSAAWKVTGQNIIAGQKIKSRDKIKLECKSLNDYYSSLFKDKTISEAKAAAAQEGISFIYLDGSTGDDVSNKIADIEESALQYWTINKAELYSGAEDTVALSVTYIGTPEERAAWAEAEAKAKDEAEKKAKEEAEKKAQEEAERKAIEEAEAKANAEAQSKAQKAVITALTNYYDPDLMNDDGSYKTSKFHDYSYNGRSAMTLDYTGLWKKTGEGSWHVSGLKAASYRWTDNENPEFAEVDVTFDISFDGNKYVITNLANTANPNVILERSSPALEVTSKMIENDRISKKGKYRNGIGKTGLKRLLNDACPYGYSVGRQMQNFEFDDGSWFYSAEVTIKDNNGGKHNAYAQCLVDGATGYAQDLKIW